MNRGEAIGCDTNQLKKFRNRLQWRCLLNQVFLSPCYLALGRHLNVPIVGVSVLRDWLSETLGSPISTSFVPNVFAGFSQQMNIWERISNVIQHAMYTMQFHYYTESQNDLVKRYVDPGMPDIRQLYGDLALLLVNSHHSMKRIRPLPPAVVEVAGLHLNDDDTRKLDLVSRARWKLLMAGKYKKKFKKKNVWRSFSAPDFEMRYYILSLWCINIYKWMQCMRIPFIDL